MIARPLPRTEEIRRRAFRNVGAVSAQNRHECVLFRHALPRILEAMGRRTAIAGELAETEQPNWEPLLALVGPVVVDWFMWMFEVELADGARLQAYKHIDTRRHLHLAGDGRAFLYCPDSRYREIPPQQAIDLAFHGWNGLYRWREDDG